MIMCYFKSLQIFIFLFRGTHSLVYYCGYKLTCKAVFTKVKINTFLHTVVSDLTHVRNVYVTTITSNRVLLQTMTKTINENQNFLKFKKIKRSEKRRTECKRSLLRRQSRDTNRNIKRSVYCQYG